MLLRIGVPHLVEYVTPDGLFSVDIALRNGAQVSPARHSSSAAGSPAVMSGAFCFGHAVQGQCENYGCCHSAAEIVLQPCRDRAARCVFLTVAHVSPGAADRAGGGWTVPLHLQHRATSGPHPPAVRSPDPRNPA